MAWGSLAREAAEAPQSRPRICAGRTLANLMFFRGAVPEARTTIGGRGRPRRALFLECLGLARAPASAEIRLIAHRGVCQTLNREGLTGETCTTTRIHEPSHALIENTLPSMRAAFASGGDIVELDVHPTTDGSPPVATK